MNGTLRTVEERAGLSGEPASFSGAEFWQAVWSERAADFGIAPANVGARSVRMLPDDGGIVSQGRSVRICPVFPFVLPIPVKGGNLIVPGRHEEQKVHLRTSRR